MSSYSKTTKKLGIMFFIFLPLLAQDSTGIDDPVRYSSIGFQASFVSGIGVSYGLNETGKYRFRITGGIITDGDKTHYSYGADYQFELTKSGRFRVFLGPGFGVSGTNVKGNASSSAPSVGVRHRG